jgi:regulator of sigma E protease
MTILIFIVVLGILVLVHEFGHFATAKWIGVRVEKFSLGFGPKIFGFKKGDTEYLLSWFPLGGYVKLTGEGDGEESELKGEPWELESRNFWEKALIFSAGSLMNIIFAFAAMPIVFMFGMETPEFLNQKPIIGYLESSSPAKLAGMIPLDEIVKINDVAVKSWDDTYQQIMVHQKESLNITVKRNSDGSEVQLSIPPSKDKEGFVSLNPVMFPIIANVRYGGPAFKAGLKDGDVVTEVDGEKIFDWNQMADIIRYTKKDSLEFIVNRQNEQLKLNVSPELDSSVNYKLIGITSPQSKTFKKKYPFFTSIKEGFKENISLFGKLYDVLVQLFSFKASIKSLGGPIMIAQFTGEAYKQGLSYLLWFMSFLSLQLGILNLLPIPILDGGRIFCFLLPEFIFGRTISMKIKEISIQVTFGLLMLLLVLISYNDIMRTGIVSKIADLFH